MIYGDVRISNILTHNLIPVSTKAKMIKNTYNLRKYKNNKMIKNVNNKMIKNVKEGSANIL